MKTLLLTVLLLSGLQSLKAQPTQTSKQSATVYFILTDSTVVSGHVVRQDSSMVVVRKRNGDLTYLETYQIARQATSLPRRPSQPEETISSFKLKDGATVNGRVIRQTPVAVVVRQANGTQTYIDPGDILSAETVSGEPLFASPDGAPVGMPYLLNSRTAFTPRAGQVYYRNTYLIRNELEAGITNGWSAGVVFNPLLTSFYKTSEYLNDAIYINTDFGTQLYTRIGIPIGRKVRLGAVLSGQFQHPSYATSALTRFQGQVLATFGEPRSNVTMGYTFKLGNDYPLLLTDGTLTISTMQALSPSLTIISDNFIRVRSLLGGPFARLSAALRIHRRYHAFDVGLLSSVSQSLYFGYGYNYSAIRFNVYPYLGYNVQFGRR